MKTNAISGNARRFLRGALRAATIGAVACTIFSGVAQAADIGINLSIREAPPPMRHEVVVTRPSPQHVWVAGYWAWRGTRHEWVAGRWDLPPHGRHAWVAPRWEHRGNGYVFVEGSWR